MNGQTNRLAALTSQIKATFFRREFIVFLAVGCVNTLNGIVFSTLFSMVLPVNPAFAAGYVAALIISYLLNSLIGFRQPLSVGRALKFMASYIPNFIIQNLTVWVIYNCLGWHKLIAFTLSAIIGIPVTFLLIKLFAFAKAK